MKKAIVAFVFMLVLAAHHYFQDAHHYIYNTGDPSYNLGKTEYVNPYKKHDGTHVDGYFRHPHNTAPRCIVD